MADILCGYTADRDETLIGYLYGEIEPAQRAAFEAHTATCERCRKELADLEGVRGQLQDWSAPEAIRPAVQGRGPRHCWSSARRRGWRISTFATISTASVFTPGGLGPRRSRQSRRRRG